ncbi:uncharacterized protein [Ptychodera flava]|uniref:uncharacterized protein n=1 Tax=Ptychodera flava TaxID=63121 RepID=UPI003969E6F8
MHRSDANLRINDSGAFGQNPEPTSSVNYYDSAFNSDHNISAVTKLLIEHNKRAALPPQKIESFNGDPLKYKAFIRAFRHGIEVNTEAPDDRLYYLEQFTEGRPKEIVSSCIHMNPKEGYEHARKLLEDEYGNPYVMAKAYTKQAEAWPEVKSEDKSALKEYALFLTKCDNAMKGEPHLRELDHNRNLQMLVYKLPYKLRERWRTKTFDILQSRAVCFKDLVEFVNREDKIATQELFGDLTNTSTNDKMVTKSAKKGNVKKRITSAVSTEKKLLTELKTSDNVKCSCCTDTDHKIQNCKIFAEKYYKDKKQLLRSKGLCYGCLRYAKHLVKDCTNKLTCETCGRKHPTVLHYPDSSAENEQAVTTTVRMVDATCQTIKPKQHTYKPVVIPVKLRCKATGLSVQTYAFLDNGSDTVFCTDKVRQQLNVGGKKTKVNLHTITGNKTVDSHIIKGLEVTDLEESNLIRLPPAYTQSKIPVSTDDILTQADIKSYPYLERVHLPSIDAEIGLLIGNNVPDAFEPWEVINSQGQGPFAVRTRLGWVVNGSLMRAGMADDDINQAVVNRIQVGPAVDQQLMDYFNREFSERTIDDKPEDSIEDQRFMKMMDTETEYHDGHYQVPLPFRKDNVMLPDNRTVAEYRLNQLKKRFKRDEAYYREYAAFIEGIVEKGYAERVPQSALQGHDGKKWYLPHHGVYHPQKRKIRVVFDCSAEYRGTSLNKELLQGPDLTNSLLGVLVRFRQDRIALMSDIEAMFSQVRVPKEDQDYQRFLWWPNGNVNEPPAEYRMKVHIFGATSSPSCANYALRKCADKSCDPNVKDTIDNNFYVDDMLKAVPNKTEGQVLAKRLIDTCNKGGFRLTKWISNDCSVLETIPEEERAKEVKRLDLQRDSLPSEQALGMQWNVQADVLGLRTESKINR